MSTLLFALLALGGTTPSGAPSEALSAAPPIKVWMNQERRFREGDRARLQVDASVEGYLLVLHYDTDGRVQVLFPLEPRDDNQIRAGRRYEVLDESGREAFLVGGSGTGLIYTAVSPDPWRFEDVVIDGRWDYVKLGIDRRSRDPEADLTEVVQRIAGSHGFDYDVAGYRVDGDDRYGGLYPTRTVYLPTDALYCNNWYWRYNDCRRWPYDGGWSFGASIYFGYNGYSPYDFFYSPYRFGYYPYGYGYGYSPYRYGSGGYGGFGGYPYYPYRGNIARGPVLVGRSRGFAVQPRSSLGAIPTGRGPIIATAGARPAVPGIDWRSRIPARPAREVGEGRNNRGGIFAGRDEPPPARRSRPESPVYPSARSRGEPGDRGVSNRGNGNDGDRDRGRPPRESPPPRQAPPRSEPAHGTSSGDGGSRGGSRPEPSHSSSRPRRP